MARGDRIIVGAGLAPGKLILQESAGFDETEYGWDTGQRIYLTHPLTLKRQWPQKGQTAASARPGEPHFSSMFVASVTDRLLECGFIELTVGYKGALRLPKRERVRTSGNIEVATALSSSEDLTYKLNIPAPSVIREYLTTSVPTQAGVGASGSFPGLPAAPSYDLGVISVASVAQNVVTGWVLQSRDSENVADRLWLVTEVWMYKFTFEF